MYTIKGKVLKVSKNGLYRVYGFRIYYNKHIATFKASNLKERLFSFFSKISITRRFFRIEITGLYSIENDILVVAKKGLFKKSVTDVCLNKVFSIPRGSKPLNICILPNGHIYFGEYFQNMDKVAVNLYGSKDNGITWEIVYTFDAGNINHIHGLFFDKYTNRLWVLTGDRDNECIIGYTEDEFHTFHEVLRGGQEYRSCQLFFYRDFIVYATDSQYIENEIRAIDRKTFEITKLAKIQGSAIKGGQTDEVSYLSTTVEPSDVNKDKYAHIWVTKDGHAWKEVYSARKDYWPPIFQYGTFEFPQNAYQDGKLWFSGRALIGHDNKSTFVEI